MGMGLGYLANAAGAADGLETLIARQLAQKKFEEQVAARQADDAARQRQLDLEGRQIDEQAAGRRDTNRRLDEQTRVLNEQRAAQQAETERKTQEGQARTAALEALISDPATSPRIRQAAQYFRATGQAIPRDYDAELTAKLDQQMKLLQARLDAGRTPKSITPQQTAGIVSRARAQAAREVANPLSPNFGQDAAALARQYASEDLTAAGVEDVGKVLASLTPTKAVPMPTHGATKPAAPAANNDPLGILQ